MVASLLWKANGGHYRKKEVPLYVIRKSQSHRLQHCIHVGGAFTMEKGTTYKIGELGLDIKSVAPNI